MTAEALLDRFAELYGETPMPPAAGQLWRDYFEFSGKHMILTDEGWESGGLKEEYLEEWKNNSSRWTNPILDEVNAPA